MEPEVQAGSSRKKVVSRIYIGGVKVAAFFVFSAFGHIMLLALLHMKCWMGFSVSDEVFRDIFTGAVTMTLLATVTILLTRAFVRATYPELDRDVSADEACARLNVTGWRALLVKGGWFAAELCKR
ncbi:MAG TPA: hypothetical protein VNS79_14625 [Sphingobium sp.]|nr:hypothetical protein [Sphingobium sp.]